MTSDSARSAPAPIRLAAAGLTKTYGQTRVLHGVDLDVAAGEIHALVGENGAGKSTLIKILTGAVRPDAGSVRLDGVAVPIGDPRAAQALGIRVVYQEFTLVPELSIADNIFLGCERAGVFLKRAEMAAAARRVLADLGAPLDPATPVRTLSVAHQQLVEIARALAGDAKVLIFDEPTASLSGHEVEHLLDVMRALRGRGLAVLFVSHRFEEIFAVADRITVLRDGARVAGARAADVTRAEVIRWMVGRDIAEEFPPKTATRGDPRLVVQGLSAGRRFRDVSFTVRAGEVVGLAGLVGAGRTSVGLALGGALPASGSIRIDGQAVSFRSPSDAVSGGLAYVTEDRKGRGLFPAMSTSANLTIAHLASFTRRGWLAPALEREGAATAARDVDVRGRLDQTAGTLSGGNQQKVLVSRFLLTHPKVLVLDEPTRGVDVGARAEIYGIIQRLADAGLAIVLISSDLPEVLGMADRVVVMRSGRVTGELDRQEATPEAVMALATHP